MSVSLDDQPNDGPAGGTSNWHSDVEDVFTARGIRHDHGKTPGRTRSAPMRFDWLWLREHARAATTRSTRAAAPITSTPAVATTRSCRETSGRRDQLREQLRVVVRPWPTVRRQRHGDRRRGGRLRRAARPCSRRAVRLLRMCARRPRDRGARLVTARRLPQGPEDDRSRRTRPQSFAAELRAKVKGSRGTLAFAGAVGEATIGQGRLRSGRARAR